MITENIAKQIAEICQDKFDIEVSPEVSYVESSHGDVTTNVSMKLASRLNKNPREIADIIAKSISDKYIKTIDIAGPGFINFVLEDKYWIDSLKNVANIQSENKNPQNVQVEFISANPTGPLTLGNARGGFVGDVLANIIEKTGSKVTREYYFNDAGTQIKELVKSVRSAAGEDIEGDIQYSGSYIKDLASKLQESIGETDEELGKKATEEIFSSYIKPSIDSMNIEFDEYFNERSLLSEWPKLEQLLRHENLIYNKDDALWLKSSSYGDERDRVLRKSNGDNTYLANDIAYHRDIFVNRKFDKSIKIWGSDHAGQVPSLKLTINRLFPGNELDFIILQWVRLIKQGKEVKMSKRLGTFVTVQDLIDEVGADVARFFFLLRSGDSHMDFDLDLAKEESQKNPYYYLMYSYSRAHSIIKQAEQRGIKPSNSTSSLTDFESDIIKDMVQLKGLVLEVSKSYEVHKLSYYGLEIAKKFHNFYENVRVINLKKDTASEKLYFIKNYIDFMDRYFEVLGIKPQEEM